MEAARVAGEGAGFGSVRLSSRSTHLFGMLRTGTGLGPEPCARLALCLSLGQRGAPNPDEYNTDGSEYTPARLFGGDANVYLSLVASRLRSDGLDAGCLGEMTRAHVNRGAISLKQRVSDASDIFNLYGEIRGKYRR